MTFSPGIPASGQTLGQSRALVNGNFANYNTVMSVNHVAPNAVGQGKHKFVEMPVQASNPSTLSGEGGLFTKTTSGQSEMYYLRDTEVGSPIYQMTGPLFTAQGALSKGGTTMLFGGIILKWGSFNGPGAKLFATECGNAFPNNCFLLFASFVFTALSATGFTTNAGVTSGTFIAIGN